MIEAVVPALKSPSETQPEPSLRATFVIRSLFLPTRAVGICLGFETDVEISPSESSACETALVEAGSSRKCAAFMMTDTAASVVGFKGL